MNASKKRRLAFAAALVAVGALVAVAIVYSLGQNTMYFQSPSDVAANAVRPGMAFRLGGLVTQGSVTRGPGADVRFTVTDGKSSVPVTFHGVLPALFRVGLGIVTPGALNTGGTFLAS